jgi:hypothetical protein
MKVADRRGLRVPRRWSVPEAVSDNCMTAFDITAWPDTVHQPSGRRRLDVFEFFLLHMPQVPVDPKQVSSRES